MNDRSRRNMNDICIKKELVSFAFEKGKKKSSFETVRTIKSWNIHNL